MSKSKSLEYCDPERCLCGEELGCKQNAGLALQGRNKTSFAPTYSSLALWRWTAGKRLVYGANNCFHLESLEASGS
ncbi:hypothetical protein LINPERPRIM_LOCUS11145 [Linum perenne]